MVEHGVSEFFVIEGNEILFEIEWFRNRRNIFFVSVGLIGRKTLGDKSAGMLFSMLFRID